MWWIPRLSRITRLRIPLLLLREALCRVATSSAWSGIWSGLHKLWYPSSTKNAPLDMVLLDYQDTMIPTLGKVGMESFISDALEQFLLMPTITLLYNNDDDSDDWELLSHSVNQLIR